MRTTVTRTADGRTWYDVLGVELFAPESYVEAAWKQAIWDLDPGDRRFRMLNQAGEVLLDRDRRAAYDAELLAAGLGAEPDEPTVPQTPSRAGKATGESGTRVTARTTGRVVPGWLLVTVATVAALVVGACAVVAATAPSAMSVADATRDAQASAERAIVAVLSFDGTSAARLEADQRAAEGLMTANYRDEYAELMEVVESDALASKSVVTAEVVATGVVRSDERRVTVLVFVDRRTTSDQPDDPVIREDQVTVTMEKVGDQWLVDDLVPRSPDVLDLIP